MFLFVFSSCSKIPTPSLLAPSENQNIQPVSFGDNPVNYQKILKEYQKQEHDHDHSKEKKASTKKVTPKKDKAKPKTAKSKETKVKKVSKK